MYVAYVRMVCNTLSRVVTPVSFDDDWCASAYLRDYYSAVENDECVTMQFLVDAAAFVGDVPRLLEFGCGPTVHHLFPFAPRAAEIHVADYLDDNLAAVRGWVDGADDAHDWSPFAEYTLRAELGRGPSARERAEREELTRDRITTFRHVDARRTQPFRDGRPARYPAVLCCFCPDSITGDLEEWRRCTEHVAGLVAPGGWLVLAALGGASSYRVGPVRFPSAGVVADDVAALLMSCGFSRLGTSIITARAVDDGDHGFDAVVLAVSRKP